MFFAYESFSQLLDYAMAKVVSSRISARSICCILQRVMGLVSPEDRSSKGGARPITRGRIQLGRAEVREDTTLAQKETNVGPTSHVCWVKPSEPCDNNM